MTPLGWFILILLLVLVLVVTPKLMNFYIDNENFRGGIGRLFFLNSFLISFCIGCLLRFRWSVFLGLTIALAILSIIICEYRIRRNKL